MGVMNTYYLKKFRKEAQRIIKARYNPIQLEVRYPYDCVEKGQYIDDSMAADLNMLRRKLLEFRRQYILSLAEEKRCKKLNKKLAKL